MSDLANKLWRRFICAIFGHRMYVKQEFTKYSRRVQCLCCDGDWGMNDDARAFIPWNKELEDLHRMLGRRILK